MVMSLRKGEKEMSLTKTELMKHSKEKLCNIILAYEKATKKQKSAGAYRIWLISNYNRRICSIIKQLQYIIDNPFGVRREKR